MKNATGKARLRDPPALRGAGWHGLMLNQHLQEAHSPHGELRGSQTIPGPSRIHPDRGHLGGNPGFCAKNPKLGEPCWAGGSAPSVLGAENCFIFSKILCFVALWGTPCVTWLPTQGLWLSKCFPAVFAAFLPPQAIYLSIKAFLSLILNSRG